MSDRARILEIVEERDRLRKNPSQTFSNIDTLFRELVPQYKSRSWRPFLASFDWDRSIADHMETISPRRCHNRRKSYLIPGELHRAKQSIRFGNLKTGHGYRGERGDFCVVAGVKSKKHLTLFYRRVELIGGLHYDTVLIRAVEDVMGEIKTVHIMACEAFVFALRGNSNEKLYRQLSEFYAQRS